METLCANMRCVHSFTNRPVGMKYRFLHDLPTRCS